ncbi:MAG: DM13 domain-containing protein [Alphaproteobacteria bacterium]|nr:DM13 domain-containing protein [Alphaproteobacteria bacterium]
MKRFLLAFVIGGLLGGFAGFAVGIFVYPYIFLADVVAEEQLTDAASRRVVASGDFIHANPSDPIHYGKGKVTVYDGLVRLEEDFEVGPGPRFHVYLVPLDEVTPDTEVDKTMFVDLGQLRAFKGSQNFMVPAGTDLAKFGHVVIWCKEFDVLISPARLAFGS